MYGKVCCGCAKSEVVDQVGNCLVSKSVDLEYHRKMARITIVIIKTNDGNCKHLYKHKSENKYQIHIFLFQSLPFLLLIVMEGLYYICVMLMFVFCGSSV